VVGLRPRRRATATCTVFKMFAIPGALSATIPLQDRKLVWYNFALYWFFMPYILTFVSILFFAYKRIFDVNYYNSSYSLIVPLVIVLLIYFLVCHAGASLCRLLLHKEIVGTLSRLFQWVSFWTWFIILLLFSAYGVYSSLMLYIEGPVIMRESLSDASGALTKLGNSAQNILAHPEWDKFVSEVRAAKLQFHNTILPPTSDFTSRYCGIGIQAEGIKKTLTELLPGFQITAGDDQDHDCSHRAHFQLLQHNYDVLIDTLLVNHPMRSAKRIVERDDLRNKILAQNDSDEILLSKALSMLDWVTTFFPDLTLYHKLSGNYAIVSQHYADSYNKLLGFGSAEALSIEPSLVAPAVDQIATPWRVPDVVVARANRGTTWIFLFIAIAVDLIASALAANAVYVLTIRQTRLDFARAARSVAGTDVAYIWRPDPRP
jgi:hypothetical protein